MDKTYQPDSIEQAWYQTWEKAGHFRPSGEGESFAMMIPLQPNSAEIRPWRIVQHYERNAFRFVRVQLRPQELVIQSLNPVSHHYH